MLKSYDHDVISHIRSLLIWKVPFSIRWPEEILSLQKFKLLRVFTASSYKFSNHNIRSITELVYLKYLCLLDCRLEEELPSSIDFQGSMTTLAFILGVSPQYHSCIYSGHLFPTDLFSTYMMRIWERRWYSLLSTTPIPLCFVLMESYVVRMSWMVSLVFAVSSECQWQNGSRLVMKLVGQIKGM
ncbi:hypothetical protein POM88_033080 [Heracleum sosnowskyi]|uniref:Uncharacterized protein n=1 Tax=Heracleum sosnowskyi TaxID=360622 RepID=A0AAD8I2N0_9APIA|nr:hypothetical protein POM88_033080 [Heracleum sosnowskyi]